MPDEGISRITNNHDELDYKENTLKQLGGEGLVSTFRDYRKFCEMLLAGGSYKDKVIISPESFCLMTTTVSPAQISSGDSGGGGSSSTCSSRGTRNDRSSMSVTITNASTVMVGHRRSSPGHRSRCRRRSQRHRLQPGVTGERPYVRYPGRGRLPAHGGDGGSGRSDCVPTPSALVGDNAPLNGGPTR